ncbi:MAG TPA: zf-HC2 domain-containing protein [Acidobacteriaceae bacterium]|nr:zf-HC2 domain-containing protein [Acidobacteriaceae bacterium]
MADQNQFGNVPNAAGLRCEDWEALLADALDGRLPAAQADAFRAHGAACLSCSDLLDHAKQGQEWLGFLHAEPEIPADLVSRILDKTVGVGAIPIPVVTAASAGAGTAAVALPVRRSFHEMRLLMTVAMAFFSIALTLDMVGVRMTSLKISDLRPSSIGSTISRQFYGARSSVVRFYDNMRFVYQLESRVREMRRDIQPAPQQQNQKQQQPSGKSSDKDGRLNPPPAPGETVNANWKANGGSHEAQTEIIGTNNQTTTEVLHLNPLRSFRAGPRQVIAGYEGRSLA